MEKIPDEIFASRSEEKRIKIQREARDGATARPRGADYNGDLKADLRDFDVAVAYLSACAIEGALDVGLRDVLAANHDALVEKCRALAAEWRKQVDEGALPTDRIIGIETCADQLLRALGDGR